MSKVILCVCNNCNGIFIDTNPKSGAIKVAIGEMQPLSLTGFDVIEEGKSEWVAHCCPTCKTDAHLMDLDEVPELFARQCSLTGKGMNEGWCFGDGEAYARTAYGANKIAKQRGNKSILDAFNNDDGYWTEWEMPFDAQWQLVNGKLIEYENN